ncbi:MAG TPA: hypothetical protein VGR26_06585 [Acidimicrobiales bacterium]|nr:hypothetical protein [Acidimicrobiales bacterium]
MTAIDVASFECRVKAVRTRLEGDAVTKAIMPEVAFPPAGSTHALRCEPCYRVERRGAAFRYDAGVEAIRTLHEAPDEGRDG